jgi:cytidylate kinase
MTREKRELLAKLEKIDIAEDREMSIGEMSESAMRSITAEFDTIRRPILERLNVLMHGRINDYFCACVL